MTFRRLALAVLSGTALSAAALTGVARAGDLTVTVRDARGKPVADAVVTVDAPGRKAPARYAQPLRMSQRDQMFVPFVLTVPVGATVNFANEDKVRHQVYSFSPAKKFELALFGRDQTHSIRFDKAGVVALGCNIHDSMVAYIKVVDAAYAETTDGSGRAVIHDLPAGPVQVRVWAPYLRAPGNELRLDVVVPAAGGVQRDVSAVVLAPHP